MPNDSRVIIAERHAKLVKDLHKPGEVIKTELDAIDCNLIHSVLGICGEAGEILDTIKKATIYRKPIDFQNLTEELGDLEFYMEQLRQTTGITREGTLLANIEKLNKRYPEGKFTNQQAQERKDKQQ